MAWITEFLPLAIEPVLSAGYFFFALLLFNQLFLKQAFVKLKHQTATIIGDRSHHNNGR